MELTKTERWILSNQYKVLESLYPDEAEDYGNCRKVLERGYELHYNEITGHIDADVMSEDECDEVIDILTMFKLLRRAYDDLQEKPDIEELLLKFSGFDGNNERKQLSYARFFLSHDSGRVNDLDWPDVSNSHFPVIEDYRRMLIEWKKSKKEYHLTPDDIVRISSARNQDTA